MLPLLQPCVPLVRHHIPILYRGVEQSVDTRLDGDRRASPMHWLLLRARASDMHSSTPPTSPCSPPHVPSTWLGHGPWSPAWPDHSKAFSGQQQLSLCTCWILENIPIQLSDVLKNSPITHFVTTSFPSKKAINIGNDLAMKPAKIILGWVLHYKPQSFSTLFLEEIFLPPIHLF